MGKNKAEKQTRIKIDLSNYYQMHESAVKVCEAMAKTGRYYWKAGELEHGLEEVTFSHKGEPYTYLPTKKDIFFAVSSVAYSERKDGLPPKNFIDYIYNMSAGETPFKPLEQIIRIPIFSSDSRLMTEPGYYAEDMVLYIPRKDIDVRISLNPTKEEIKEAKSVLENDVLANFRFISPTDKTHALAYLLLFFVRKMITGLIPLHIFEADDPQTASFLMRKLTPDRYVVLDNPTDSEFRRNVRQKMVCRPEEKVSAFCLENISKLKLPALELMLSAQQYSDRIPGKNKMIDTEIKWILAAAGRKVIIDTYMARRCIKSRFVYNGKCPEYCSEDIKNTNKIIQSGLTLVQAWIAAGRPRMNRATLGGFEKWSEIIGSIVTFHDYPDFLGNYRELYDEADRDAASAWGFLLTEWWKKFGSRAVTTGELLPIAEAAEGIYLGKDDRETSKKRYLSRIFSGWQNTITSIESQGKTISLQLQKGSHTERGLSWSLRPVRQNLSYGHDKNS